MTQLEAARAGTITPQMRRVAQRENVAAETIRDGVARGRIVIPANLRHLAGAAGDDPQADPTALHYDEAAAGHPGFRSAALWVNRTVDERSREIDDPRHCRGERAAKRLDPMGIGRADHDQDQRQHRRLPGQQLDRRRGREAALGAALRRRHLDGPLHRRRSRRLPAGDHRPQHHSDRHGADLQHDRRHAHRGSQLRPHPARDRAPGSQGVDYFTVPRRRPARAPAAGQSPCHRHRVARRLAACQVDDPSRQAEPDVRNVRRDQRHHARVRRHVLARRRPASRLPGRRLRCRPARRAARSRRARAPRPRGRCAGDGRRPRSRSDGPDRLQHAAAAAPLRRRAVLRARPLVTDVFPATTTSPAPSAPPRRRAQAPRCSAT
jgi:hypothetical protein